MAGIDLSLSGLASGFDWKAFIEQIIEVQRAPQQRLLQDQLRLNQRNTAYTDIKTQLETLQTRLQTLKDPALYDSRAALVSDSAAGSATAANGAMAGTFVFHATQLATASRMLGTANTALPLAAAGLDIPLADAAFPIAVTAGTFTVNGHQITIATTDTLPQVADKISAATAGEVNATYDSATDKITLTSGQEIILGSATDTSNFLLAARLYNNGTGVISSALALGSARLNATLGSANLATAITGGADGAGEFKINGVSITFNTGTDTLNSILARINSSAAGVSASYDAVNDRFVLTSKATGDMGIALEDVTGNFLAATGLSAGTLEHGQNLIYTVNGSDPMISQSNTVPESISGIPGLTVTLAKANTDLTVTVGSDNEKIKLALQDFIEAYNRVQSLIDSQTASSTDAKGVVTAGILAGESDADEIASRLRSLIYSPISGLTGMLDHLGDLGVISNGNDNTVTVDAAQLDAALSAHLADIKELFTDGANGLAVKLDEYLTRTIGDDGTLTAHQTLLTRQSTDIDQQVADLDRLLDVEKERLTNAFVAMETAQARLNQQLQFLLRQLDNND